MFGLEIEGAMALEIQSELFPDMPLQDQKIDLEIPLKLDLFLGKDKKKVLHISIDQLSENKYMEFVKALKIFAISLDVWELKNTEIDEFTKLSRLEYKFTDTSAQYFNYFTSYLSVLLKIENPSVLIENKYIVDIVENEFREEISDKHLYQLYKQMCLYNTNAKIFKYAIVHKLSWIFKNKKVYKEYTIRYLKILANYFLQISFHNVLKNLKIDQLTQIAEAIIRYNNFIPKKKIDQILSLAMNFTSQQEKSTQFVETSSGLVELGEDKVVLR